MFEGERRGFVDRGVEGPPTEDEKQLLEGLNQLDELRMRGEVGAIKRFLDEHPRIRAFDKARRDVLKTQPLENETERQHEEQMRKLAEIWSVALVESNKIIREAGSPKEAEETFERIFEQEIERYRPGVEVLYVAGAYCVVGPLDGYAYVFVRKNPDVSHPVFRKFFTISGDTKAGHVKSVIRPASFPGDIREAETKDLARVDSHLIQMGEVEFEEK